MKIKWNKRITLQNYIYFIFNLYNFTIGNYQIFISLLKLPKGCLFISYRERNTFKNIVEINCKLKGQVKFIIPNNIFNFSFICCYKSNLHSFVCNSKTEKSYLLNIKIIKNN